VFDLFSLFLVLAIKHLDQSGDFKTDLRYIFLKCEFDWLTESFQKINLLLVV